MSQTHEDPVLAERARLLSDGERRCLSIDPPRTFAGQSGTVYDGTAWPAYEHFGKREALRAWRRTSWIALAICGGVILLGIILCASFSHLSDARTMSRPPWTGTASLLSVLLPLIGTGIVILCLIAGGMLRGAEARDEWLHGATTPEEAERRRQQYQLTKAVVWAAMAAGAVALHESNKRDRAHHTEAIFGVRDGNGGWIPTAQVRRDEAAARRRG